MLTPGKCSPTYLTIYHSQLLCKDKYLEHTEDYPPILRVLTTSENLTEFRKYPMKVQSVTCFGVTQMRGLGLM